MRRRLRRVLPPRPVSQDAASFRILVAVSRARWPTSRQAEVISHPAVTRSCAYRCMPRITTGVVAIAGAGDHRPAPLHGAAGGALSDALARPRHGLTSD